ncbi:MAG TPA: hypothetical protein VEQ59_09940, partial [Polyangiaceae bacterium]|nr:hypothetical protein [Polyangiaceae bacterium]
MSRRVFSLVAGAGLLGVGVLSLAILPRAAPAAPKPAALVRAQATVKAAPTDAAPVAVDVPSRFQRLPALHVENQTTRESVDLKLYDRNGAIDGAAAAQLDELVELGVTAVEL